MAPAPPHIIFKRIVKGMVKRMIPPDLKEAKMAKIKLQQCLTLNGPDSPKCVGPQLYYDSIAVYEQRYKAMIKHRKYENLILKHAAPPQEKVEMKGKKRFNYSRNYHKFKLVGMNFKDKDK
jgi:hypothetical protein